MNPLTIPQPGAPAPDFRLRGPGGVFYSLSEFRGEKHVLLVFYPLAFSPVCAHQLPEIEAAMPRLREAGVEVFGISVDSHWANAAFARALRLSFPLLSDWKREASTAFGTLIPGAHISARALVLVDRDGRIAWREDAADSDSIEHIPSPDRALAALEAAPRD